MADIELAVFERAAKQERVVLQLREYRGHRFVDLRVYVLGKDGSWLPTAKGATVKVDELDELASGIASAIRIVRG